MNKSVRGWFTLFYVLLVVHGCVILSPVIWLFLQSFKNNQEFVASPLALPSSFSFANYASAFPAISRYFLNSLLVVACTLIISLTFSSMAAYGISRMRWKLSGTFKIMFLLGMMIPVHSIMIPLMVIFSKLKLTDSYIGLIIPYTVFSFAQAIFILSGFFTGLPRELEEAAVIDGCSIWRCFWRIILPLAKPGIATVALFVFNGTWNELLLGIIFINSDSKKTLPVGLTMFVGPYSTNYGPMIAAIMLAIIPVAVIYCMFSNQIVGGLTAGSVKG